MKSFMLAISALSLFLFGSNAFAQETAKVQVSLTISDKTPSFKDHRLVISLYHDFPLQDDRGNRTVDRHIEAKFSHTKGTPTKLTVTLGEKVKLNPNVQYSVTLSVFTPDSKLTHIGAIDGEAGPFPVLNGGPSRLTIIVRPAP